MHRESRESPQLATRHSSARRNRLTPFFLCLHILRPSACAMIKSIDRLFSGRYALMNTRANRARTPQKSPSGQYYANTHTQQFARNESHSRKKRKRIKSQDICHIICRACRSAAQCMHTYTHARGERCPRNATAHNASARLWRRTQWW